MFRENNLHTRSYLTYRVGNKIYASSSSEVRKILDPRSILTSSDCGLGNFITIDQKEIPIINLRERFGPLHDSNLNFEKSTILILKIGLRQTYSLIAIFVDEVLELIDVDLNQISTSPLIDDSGYTDFMEGFLAYKGSVVNLLNIRKLVNSDDSVIIRTWNNKRKLVLIN